MNADESIWKSEHSGNSKTVRLIFWWVLLEMKQALNIENRKIERFYK